MAEISNRVLAALLVAAIIVSLGGTMISLNQLQGLEDDQITGFATVSSTADVAINITTIAGLQFKPSANAIDFGSGYVNTTHTVGTDKYKNCTMYMDGTESSVNGSSYSNVFCLGTDWADDVWVGSQTPLILENIGSTYLNVSLILNESGKSWLPSMNDTMPTYIQFKVNPNEDTEANVCNSTMAPATFSNLSNTTNTTACEGLHYDTAKNELAISVKVIIPSQVKNEYRNEVHNIQLTATALDLGTETPGGW